MKILIVYTTRHGCTEKCALKLQQYLDGEAELVNLKNSKPAKIDKYATIIIGGSIHAGQIQKRIKRFCQENLETLKKKKIGLFICCMEKDETAQKEFQDAFADELITHASAKGIFGGEFNFEKMNFIEKAIVKKVANVDKSVSTINEQKIIEFAQQINNRGKILK